MRARRAPPALEPHRLEGRPPTTLSEGGEKGVKRYLRVKKWGMVDVVRHGRIYRLVPDSNKSAPKTPKMLDESPAQLVAHLANRRANNHA